MAPKDKTTELPEAPAPHSLFSTKRNQEIPTLPTVHDKTKLDVRYPLIEPHAYAHLYYDQTTNEIVYKVEEPQLDPQEKQLLETIERGIGEIINISFINVKAKNAVIEYLEKNIKVLLAEMGVKVGEETFIKLMYYIYRDFVGINEIEPLMHDFFIEDIECNGLNAPVYIVHRKYRNMRTNVVFTDMDKLTSFVEKLSQKCGKYISYASPIMDGRLPDGSRINATFTQEISARGPNFTIRKFTKEPWSPVKLMRFRTVSPEILAYLWLLVEYEMNFIVIGGTGSGKTSFLNSIAFFIPPSARIVSIEDTHEMQILHENWLPSVAREATGVGAEGRFGEVNLFTLLRSSFRQRPDYVIVGEIRGKEAYVLFQGAASGHPSACTMHADNVDTMVRRLQTPPISLPASLVETIDVVCAMTQARVQGEEVRRLKSVVEIINVSDAGKATINTPFIWDPATDTFFFKTESKMFLKLAKNYGLSRENVLREFSVRTKLLMELYKRGIEDPKSVQNVINAYHKTPQDVLRRFNIE